ncbi:MAG: hypothetical protein JWM96_1362 [Alphaproteobacteria bacterium]|nr:hypothetical protein [Alphaproteobacteria bacterium]
MRKGFVITITAVLFVSLAGLSPSAFAAGAREALGGLTSADDAVVHDNGNVSVCKGGKFPGCKGGRAFHCPAGGECTETPANFVSSPGKDHAAPTGAVLDPGTRGPVRRPRPDAPTTGTVLQQR